MTPRTPATTSVVEQLPPGRRGRGGVICFPLSVVAGTHLHLMVGSTFALGDYFCNYGVNEDYEPAFQAAGLHVSARGPEGETRAVELPEHPFYVATLFQPQLASSQEHPHPIIVSYLLACVARKSTGRNTTSIAGRRNETSTLGSLQGNR